ncbi:hypothetical protein Tco_0654066 [Tanacetum coccineum]|uniref:Retrovirus-related Pol polyprotein from transposon TNT 1-94 n=1 Tax=Tanacetum coccineum TaxID=301880 RepID=A0ABQ4X265_9ASTR
MTTEVPQTLEYRGGQLISAPLVEVENITKWKKRFMCHIVGIQPQFKKIIFDGPYVSKTAGGAPKPEPRWTVDERKAVNLDQCLKSLNMSCLPDDLINYVINYETTTTTWEDLILNHEGPSDVKENRVIDLKLCYNTFKHKECETVSQTFTRYKALMNELVNDGVKLSKHEINIGFINNLPKKWLSFSQSLKNANHVRDSDLASLFGKIKYEETLIDQLCEYEKKKTLITATPLSTAFFSNSIMQDFQDGSEDEEDTRSSQEYSDDLEMEFHERALLANSKSKAKLAILTSCAFASQSAQAKNKGLVVEAYKLDEEEFSSNDNELVEVKVLMELVDDEKVIFGKESARDGEWVNISIKKVHTLLTLEDNDERKSFLAYLYIDLNFVEELRNNLMLKHRNIIIELNTCKE